MTEAQPIPALSEPTVMFVINREWSHAADDDAVYEATRGDWKVGADTRERAVYAFGVAGGIVRGAYRIEGWRESGGAGRWRFVGVPAVDLEVVGTSVARLAPPRGAANPVRRFLDGIPAPSTRPVQELAHELNLEPLARIMYGQRELFHSNFIAWFFDALPDIADAVFRDLSDPDVYASEKERCVERERENLDIVMRWPGRAPLVVENKVFSLPDAGQLRDYLGRTARWKGASPRHVLLSMAAPLEPVEGWFHLSYQDLAERIDLALPEGDSYELETLRRYSRIVRLLSGLLDSTAVQSTAERAWLDSAQLGEIDSTQTRTALRKLRSQRIQQLLNDQGPEGGWSDAAISHGESLVGWRRPVIVDGVEIEAGWQYQGGQFRLCAVLPHLAGRADEDRRARAEFVAEHPELFDFTPLLTILEQQVGEVRPLKGVGHFAPDFVYRYVKVHDLSVAQLLAATHAIGASLGVLSEGCPKA